MNNQNHEENEIHKGVYISMVIGIVIAVLGILSSLFYIISINRDMTPSGLAGINGDYKYPFTEYEVNQLFKLITSNIIFISGVMIAWWGRKIKNTIVAVGIPLGVAALIILLCKAFGTIALSEKYPAYKSEYSTLNELLEYNEEDAYQSAKNNIEWDANNLWKTDSDFTDVEYNYEYRTFALFGVDSREGQLEDGTLTDTIIIVSINLDTKEVKLVSVYRDTWLNLGTGSYNKANAAYARGGYRQAIAMLNMNLDLAIEDYVTIGFEGLTDVVDAVGGIEIDVKEEEIVHLNNYQISMAGRPTGDCNVIGEPNYTAKEGVDYTPVTHAGVQVLNGLQATAYTRIRYIGSESGRAARARTVLTKTVEKAMTLEPDTLSKVIDAVFPRVETSLSISEVLELFRDSTHYQIAETTGFPFEGYINMRGRVGPSSVIVPVDLEKNVSLLHEFLFNEEDYKPSDTVRKCSERIAANTANETIMNNYRCNITVNAPQDYSGGSAEVFLFTSDGSKLLWYEQNITNFPVKIKVASFASPSDSGNVVISYLVDLEQETIDEDGEKIIEKSSQIKQINQQVTFIKNDKTN